MQQTETTYVVTDDVPTDTKRALIAQDVQMWKNTRWQTEMRLRAYTRNNLPEQAKEQVDLVARCEGMLASFEEELEKLG